MYNKVFLYLYFNISQRMKKYHHVENFKNYLGYKDYKNYKDFSIISHKKSMI